MSTIIMDKSGVRDGMGIREREREREMKGGMTRIPSDIHRQLKEELTGQHRDSRPNHQGVVRRG